MVRTTRPFSFRYRLATRGPVRRVSRHFGFEEGVVTFEDADTEEGERFKARDPVLDGTVIV